MPRPQQLMFAALCAFAVGCSSDKGTPTPVIEQNDSGADAATTGDATTTPDSSRPDAGEMFVEDPRGIACAEALETVPVDAWHPEGRIDPVHYDSVANAAQICLSNFIQINTTNPPAATDPGEIAAVHFFETIFRRWDMPTQRAPMSRNPDPKRLSMVATREGTSEATSVLLLNHTDAVPAEGTWTHGPHSGHFDGEHVWGRGALDMKGIGISQLVALSILHRAGVEFVRDVHFVAVADEEIGGQGAEYIATTKYEDGAAEAIDPLGLNPGVVLNEGGNGLRDALLPHRDVFVMGLEEKGKVWTQFAHNDPGTLAASIVKLGVIPPPPAEMYGATDLRTTLGAACTLTHMMSDSQKANVQPMSVDLTFSCDPGHEADMQNALSNLGSGLDEVSPTVTIDATAQGGKEDLAVKIAFGVGGHGAAGVEVNVLNLAAAALVSAGQVDESEMVQDEPVRDRYFDWVMSPANQEMVSSVARNYGETASEAAEALVKESESAQGLLDLAHSFLPIDSPFKTSCSWTNVRFDAGDSAFAKLDCRLNSNWPDAKGFEAEIAGFMNQHGVELRSAEADCYDCSYQNFNASEFGPAVRDYAIVKYLVERSSPDALVTPYLFPASSDSYWYRSIGVPVYAIWPIALYQEELETIHAIDERAPIPRMTKAIDIYAQIIKSLANFEEVPPADNQHQLKSGDVTCSQWDKDNATWVPFTEDSLDCLDFHYTCTVADDAPRFIRARARELDAKIIHVTRMQPGYQPTNELLPAGQVDVELYHSRNIAENGALQDGTRVFPDQEFSIDTGTGTGRTFSLQCATPLHQIVADESGAFLDFYKD